MIEWNKYFDHIYCINFIPYSDKREAMKTQFKRIGIDTHADYFSWKYTYSLPAHNFLYNKFNKIQFPDFTEKVFRITLAHYEVLYESKAFNYNRILILEDDATFLKDINKIQIILNNFPNDDIVLFDKVFEANNSDNVLYDSLIKDNNYFSNFNNYMISGACYSVTNFGINILLQIYNDVFLPTDFMWNDNLMLFNEPKVNIPCSRSFAINNMAIQNEKSYFDNYINIQHLNLSDYL